MKVLLGVTGSVAAFKSIILSRLLHKRGIEHRVILTRAALEFIKPLSFTGTSGVQVFTDEDFFKGNLHIELARWGDILLVAPATANFISKFARGIADNLLLSTAMAFKGKIFIAPAMHTEMWQFQPLQENVRKLMDIGVEFIGPEEGELASGDRGMGRMTEPEDILGRILSTSNRKVLLVYGRTEEDIDDVRVITNRSSGRMGFEIHRALMRRGIYHQVIIAGCVDYIPSGVKVHRVRRTEELLKVLKSLIPQFDTLIMAAAISDFIPQKVKGKLNRRKGEIQISLEPNVDVLKQLKSLKGERIFVGFALEEEDKLMEGALRKMSEKGLDFVVANRLNAMGSATSTGMILGRGGKVLYKFENRSKEKVADKLVELIASV